MIQYSKMRRMPAEWEPQDAILMAFPHPDTDWNYMLPEITKCYIDIIKAILPSGESLVVVTPEPVFVKSLLQEHGIYNVSVIKCITNDTWTRDYCAISVITSQGEQTLLDFKFNGWGLKFASCFDNLVNSYLNKQKLFNVELENHLSFVLEGGSIESDGCGTIMTTSECLLSPNRNGGNTKHEIEDYLKATLGASRILWLNHGYLKGDDTDSHIDTLARFVDCNSIAYVKCYDENDEHFHELNIMEEELRSFQTASGSQYNLIPLPLPSAIFDEDGERLPATYANFLILNDRIILPVYSQPENDAMAINALSKAFPDKEIVPVLSNALIKQHGSIHCATMQFPKGFINKDLL